MDRLWSPWRAGYVATAGKEDADACFLCAAAGDGDGAELVVARDAECVTLLNRFPYNPGHVMVAPCRHVPDLIDAGEAMAAALMVCARRAMLAIAEAMHPDGFNLGVNHGGAAGASIEHVHLHVVPRWTGDTNFMPVAASTKVLPESLEDTARKLRAAFGALE